MLCLSNMSSSMSKSTLFLFAFSPSPLFQTSLLPTLYIFLQETMANQTKGLKSMSKFSAGARKLPALIEKFPVKYNWLGSRKPKREGDENGAGRIEGRKSVSHVETSLNSVASFLQVKVLVSDMPEFMQVHAFRCARTSFDNLDKFSGKHMAYNIKKEFDKLYGPAWHCIVGSNFGSFVTHSTGGFIYFSMEKLYILLFKTKIQKAADIV